MELFSHFPFAKTYLTQHKGEVYFDLQFPSMVGTETHGRGACVSGGAWRR